MLSYFKLCILKHNVYAYNFGVDIMTTYCEGVKTLDYTSCWIEKNDQTFLGGQNTFKGARKGVGC
jgi:hypothetical protein